MSTPVFEAGGVRWWLRPGLPVDAARPLVERALAAVESGAEGLKRGRRKQLYALDLEAGKRHYFKVNLYERRRRRGSKARHELLVAERLAERGLPAPLPLAAGERYAGGRLEACFLLVEALSGATDLREEIKAPRSPACRRALAVTFGALTRRLHEAGLDQDDLRPNNVLVRWPDGANGPKPRPEIFVIDFERARLRRHVPLRRCNHALAKLDRELARAPSSIRMRFLRAYCAGDESASSGHGAATRARWHAIEALAPAVARRDAGHFFRNATLPGRRYKALRLADWSGLALPGLEPERIERAVVRGAQAEPTVTGEPGAAEWSVRLARPGLRHARQVLARALVLFARGLAPEPLALLCGRDCTVLLLERGERAVGGHEVRRNAAFEAGWRVLERRLAAYGRTTRALSETDLAVEPIGPTGVRAQLLSVEAFATRRRFGGRGARAARSR